MKRFPLSTLAALAISPALLAVNTDMNLIEAGPTLGQVKLGGNSENTAGLHLGAQRHVFGFTAVDLSARAAYDYAGFTDSSIDGARHHATIEALASASALGIVTPYVTLGLGADKASDSYIAYTGDNSWQFGPTASAGVEIVAVPKLLHITPAVRYFNADKLETLTYSLDFQFHLSAFALGIRGEYEDNRSRDGRQATALAYAALRF